jgi:hypothetical protein
VSNYLIYFEYRTLGAGCNVRLLGNDIKLMYPRIGGGVLAFEPMSMLIY